MKKIIRPVIVLILLSVTVFSFVSCANAIKGDDAKAHINGFFDAIEVEDYELAATYLHPDRPADLEAFFTSLTEAKDLDFSSIEVSQYTGFHTSFYDSSIGGSSYALSMVVDVSRKELDMEIEIVKNDSGYGIYNLTAK